MNSISSIEQQWTVETNIGNQFSDIDSSLNIVMKRRHTFQGFFSNVSRRPSEIVSQQTQSNSHATSQQSDFLCRAVKRCVREEKSDVKEHLFFVYVAEYIYFFLFLLFFSFDSVSFYSPFSTCSS